MKTLSVHQPWAWLIINGIKTVENRTWRTDYRGTLAIHAGLKIEEDVITWLKTEIEPPLTEDDLADIRTTGAIVGTVDLVDCTLTPTDPTDCEWHSPGAWAWILRNAQDIEPIAAKGRLGLFETAL